MSHRKLDEARTTEYWPVHTHRAADEIIAVEFGLNPSTAVIRRGHRLQLDVQPNVPAGLPSRSYDESAHTGVTNTIYTGPQHSSYVQLPIIPPRC